MTAEAATGVESRNAAVAVLGSVLDRGQALDDALAGAGETDGLDRRDRAFMRLLIATTLRRLGQIDALIAHCLARPLPATAKEVRNILRLGACQLAFLRTPPHAAVDSAVRIALGRGHHHHKKLVNAVLRRIAREGDAILAGQDAARCNTPDWLWQSWSDAFGEAACRAIAEAHLGEPPLDITLKDPAGAERWAGTLGAEILPTGTLRLFRAGAPAGLPGFDKGAWWVQDAAAALPAHILVGSLDGKVRDRHVIDLCAAPGGKTAQLAAAGASVTAVDRSRERLGILQRNLDRLGLAAATVAAAVEDWRPDRAGDAVLLDAPCTATGTIRRHPDIPHAKSPADVARQAARQGRLLDAACATVAPGGVLVYSVCSLQPEEGVTRIGALLAAHPEFVRAPLAAEDVFGLRDVVTGAGDIQTLPSHLAGQGGMDGFYIARLRRR